MNRAMMALADEALTLSRKGDPAIAPEAAAAVNELVPGWSVFTDNGVEKLRRTYTLPDYPSAMDLTVKVARMAEQVNHHPVITLEWGKVTVTWWTHVIGGLHRNDYIMAARCDRVAMLVTAP